MLPQHVRWGGGGILSRRVLQEQLLPLPVNFLGMQDETG